jgi:hypothetical protein
MPLLQDQELAQFFTNKTKEWEDKEECSLRASGFFTRMMLVRALGGLFSLLLVTLPTAPTLGVSPPSVPSEELVGGEELVKVQVTSLLTNFSIDGE